MQLTPTANAAPAGRAAAAERVSEAPPFRGGPETNTLFVPRGVTLTVDSITNNTYKREMAVFFLVEVSDKSYKKNTPKRTLCFSSLHQRIRIYVTEVHIEVIAGRH